MHRLFFVLISLISTNGFAIEADNLYQSYVPVATQSAEEREQVAPEVLRQVILKVVGDRSALDVTDIDSVLSQANSLVQQFQYQRLNEIDEDLTQPDRLALLLSFDDNSLNKSLTDLGLPIWAQRPEVLLWMAVDDGKSQTLLGAEASDLIPAIIKSSADKRGLSMILPVMDLQDEAQIKFRDIWSDFSHVISSASQRYGSSVILSAKVSLQPKSNRAHISWNMLINDESEQWQSRGNLEDAVLAGVEELTDRLARRFSQVVTSQQGLRLSLQIGNVAGYADYSRVMKYLSDLQYVSDVQPTSLSSEQLEVDLSLEGALSVFNETLAVGRVLSVDNTSITAGVIRYQLLP